MADDMLLRIDNQGLTLDEVKALAEALKVNQSLQQLDLRKSVG
jgi:hypothetical protein